MRANWLVSCSSDLLYIALFFLFMIVAFFQALGILLVMKNLMYICVSLLSIKSTVSLMVRLSSLALPLFIPFKGFFTSSALTLGYSKFIASFSLILSSSVSSLLYGLCRIFWLPHPNYMWHCRLLSFKANNLFLPMPGLLWCFRALAVI